MEPVLTHVETTLRVRYAETDQMGVVYYANYLIWMEVGRVEFCRAQGLRYRDLEESEGILLVVAEANCRYLAPARYDDEIRISTTLTQSTPRLIRFDYELFNQTGTRLAQGFTKHIFCGRDLRPTKLKMGTLFPVPARTPDG